MVQWTLLLITVPILAGDPGHLTEIPMVDYESCLKTAVTTLQADLESGNASIQPICMPREQASEFMSAANCHHPDIHYKPDRLNASCEGITKGSK